MDVIELLFCPPGRISEQEVVEAAERPVDYEVDMKLPPIDIARCQAREAAALK